MGTAFPLFTTQLFAKLTYHWGSTLFGCLAVLMIPIPYVRYIPSLAAASSADHDRPSLLCDAYRADRSCCGRDPRSGRGASSHRRSCIRLPHTSSGSGGRSDMFDTGFLCERELQAHRRLATLFTPLHLMAPVVPCIHTVTSPHEFSQDHILHISAFFVPLDQYYY